MPGVDDQPQLLVAEAFKERAALVDPQPLGLVGFYIYTYLCIYIYTYIRTYIHTYIHIHIYI